MKLFKITVKDRKFIVSANSIEHAAFKLRDEMKENEIRRAISRMEKGIKVSSPKEFQEVRRIAEKLGKGAEYNDRTGYVKFIYDADIEDDRLAPMTYKKLKEFGYTSDDWQKWNQEQANEVVRKHTESVEATSGGKTEKETEEVKEEVKTETAGGKGESKNSITKFTKKFDLDPGDPSTYKHLKKGQKVVALEDIVYDDLDNFMEAFDYNEKDIKNMGLKIKKIDGENLVYIPKGKVMSYDGDHMGFPSFDGLEMASDSDNSKIKLGIVE